MKKIAIWGWWQGRNLGDNWIKKTMQNLFPYASFIDTSVQDFSEFDFVICGGGGLYIYDVISPWNQNFGTIPFGAIGLGAEFEHPSQTAQILSKNASFFLVRDIYSLKCMHLSEEHRSYDITFAKPLNWTKIDELNLSKLLFVWRDGKELISNINFRQYIKYEECYSEWKKIIVNNFSQIVYNDFQMFSDDIDAVIEDCGFVISGRYHGIVSAIQKGLPFIAIDICPKIRALVNECGLDEYCIKISDVEKIANLIQKGKNEIKVIRKKEFEYRERAFRTLKIQLCNIQIKMFELLKPIKVIHYGSYWMGENDIVNTMSDDLGDLCEQIKFDLKIYSNKMDKRVKTKLSTPNGCLCVLDSKQIKEDIENINPDIVICNAGGIVFEDDVFEYAKKKHIKTVGISLSDPDVFPYNGVLYASKFDNYFTNSMYSFTHQYNKEITNIGIMPFAASIKHHFYIPDEQKIFDLVVVGHARDDRTSIVSNLRKICNVGLFGAGWCGGLGQVHGKALVRAINSGKMYLSFSKTVAGYNNVKVGLFEAMACNQFVITEYMEELENYFEIGKEIVCYHTIEELLDIVHFYLSNESERKKIQQAGYERFLQEHTYKHRWIKLLHEVILSDE